MPFFELDGAAPKVHPDAFVAPTATLVGDVTVEAGASVWYGAVLRADFSPVIVRVMPVPCVVYTVPPWPASA